MRERSDDLHPLGIPTPSDNRLLAAYLVGPILQADGALPAMDEERLINYKGNTIIYGKWKKGNIRGESLGEWD
jgi:hypothetical protein